MSEVDSVSQGLSEDESLGADRLVPVGESIRYRKRAQTAERKLQEISEQLSESKVDGEKLKVELEAMRLDRKLSSCLVSAGVNDLETAMLVARERMDGKGVEDVDSVVEQVRNEKVYLFGGFEMPAAAERTSGIKDRSSAGKGVLESVAKRAAVSGSRSDVQEYMRVRRRFVNV